MRRVADVWKVTAPGGPPALLNDIAALSPFEAWAVGQTQNNSLIQRWNGSSWSVVPNPGSASFIGAGLLGVAALSPTTAIAVGGAYDRLAQQEVPLVQHWDGASWTAYDLGSGYVLTSVMMLSDDEAWAVGHGAMTGPVALRWNGTNWIRIPTPTPSPGKLLAVAGATSHDLWAVGATDRRPLIMHFDGNGWRRVSCPSGQGSLTDVVALSDGSAWAAGEAGLLHWNGRRWRPIDAGLNSLNTLTALSPTDVWAAGGHGRLAHFDGAAWHLSGSPSPLDGSAVWLGAASVAPGTVWVVGSQQTATSNGSANLRSVTAFTQED